MNAQVEPILESSIDIHLAEQNLRLAKIRQRWLAARDFYAPIVSAFQQLGCEPRMDDAEYVTITITGDKDKLVRALRILRGSGFTFQSERPKKGDSSWYSFFDHPDCPLRTFFQFTSSVCRRVKVETKTVEQDIYETVCGDISDALPAPTVDAVAELVF